MKFLIRVVVLVGWAVGCGWAAEADVAGLWQNTAMGLGQSGSIVSLGGAGLHVAGVGWWGGGGVGVCCRQPCLNRGENVGCPGGLAPSNLVWQ